MTCTQGSQERVPTCRITRSYVPQHLNRASTSLWFGFALFPLFFAIFPLFSLFFAIFPLFPLFSSVLLLGSSVFPLISLFLCLVSLFSLYFPYIFLSILSTTYRSYLRTVLRPLCLRSYTGQSNLRRNSFLTTLLVQLLKDLFYINIF